MNATDRIATVKARIRAADSTIHCLERDPLPRLIAEVSGRIIEAYRNGNKVILFGNGGSAAQAQHLAAEMVGRFKKERRALPAIALTENAAALTAIANDSEYENVFVRQLEAWAEPGDVVIGLTTSGRSENVLRGLQVAQRSALTTVALAGGTSLLWAGYADYDLAVPSEDTPRIQEAHLLIGHIICGIVEEELSDYCRVYSVNSEGISSAPQGRRAVFLDRDGTINKKPPEGQYIRSPGDFELLPGVSRAIRRLNELDIPVIVVTNQRGVDLDAVRAIHHKMRRCLAADGAFIHAVYTCLRGVGHPDRKPNPGMLLRAAKEWGIDMSRSWMIGDSASDMAAGKAAGCKTIFVRGGLLPYAGQDVLVYNLPAAVRWIDDEVSHGVE